MKGKKLVIAVILALIVCLVLIPTCAFAEGEGEDGGTLPSAEQGGLSAPHENLGGQQLESLEQPQQPEQPILTKSGAPAEETKEGEVGEEKTPAVTANDGTGFGSIAAALNGKDASGEQVNEVTLQKNIAENVVIPEGRTIIINLNGKTLTNKDNGATVVNNGDLTINGASEPELNSGAVVGSGVSAVNNFGTATLNIGAYTSTGDVPTIFNGNGATMVIGDVEKVTGSSEVPVIYNAGTLEISDHQGGVFSNSSTGAVLYTDGRATINAGTFTTESADGSNALVVNGDDLTISGGTFSSRNKPVLLNTGFVDIGGADGKLFSNESGALIANGYISSSTRPSSGWITINNGTFRAGSDGHGILFGQTGNENGGQIAMFYGNFSGKIDKTFLNYTVGIGGIYNDASVLGFAGENALIFETGGLYYVNFGAVGFDVNPDIVNAAIKGQPITVHSVRENFDTYTDVPAGAVIVNACGQSVFVNGVEVKNGETYTVPAPAAAEDSAPAAEPVQPAAKADDKLVEAKRDNSSEQAAVKLEGTTAKITVSDSSGNAVAPHEVTIKSVTALEKSGATEASIQLDTNLVIDIDVATVKNASASDVVTVTHENNVITVKSGDKDLVSVDVKPLLEDAGQLVTVKYSESSLKVVYGGEVVFDVDLSDLVLSGEKLTVKLENGVLKIYDSNGKLLKEVEKA